MLTSKPQILGVLGSIGIDRDDTILDYDFMAVNVARVKMPPIMVHPLGDPINPISLI